MRGTPDVKGTVADRGEQLPRDLLVVFWFFALAPLFVVPFLPRSFDLGSYLEALTEGFGFASYLMRGVNGIAFALTSILLVKALVQERWRIKFLVPVLFLYAGSFGAMAFSLHPRFSLGHVVYINVLALVALLVKGKHLHKLVHLFKNITLVYIWGSLLVAAIAPQWALEFNYDQAYIQGFSVRLHGLSVHANHTAPFIWLYILLELAFPAKSRILRFTHLTLAMVTLILTQSKTTLILLFFGLLWLTLWRLWVRSRVFLLSQALLWGIVILFFLPLVLAYARETANIINLLQSILPEEAFTLTGRTFIWAVIIEVVRANPWFGYGPDLWSPEMTLLYSSWTGWVPSQSHNQYLQSLGEGGWLGLAFFLAYGFWISILAIRSFRVANGLAFVLFGSWLLRGFTEAWFRKATMDGNLLVHAMILALVISLYERANSKDL